MARKTPPNHQQPWTKTDQRELVKLAKGNTPTGLIAYKLGRTEDAVRKQAGGQNISLKPTNQSPYGTKKK